MFEFSIRRDELFLDAKDLLDRIARALLCPFCCKKQKKSFSFSRLTQARCLTSSVSYLRLSFRLYLYLIFSILHSTTTFVWTDNFLLSFHPNLDFWTTTTSTSLSPNVVVTHSFLVFLLLLLQSMPPHCLSSEK